MTADWYNKEVTRKTVCFLVVLTVRRQCFCKDSELTRFFFFFFFDKTNLKVRRQVVFGWDSSSAYPSHFKEVDKSTA